MIITHYQINLHWYPLFLPGFSVLSFKYNCIPCWSLVIRLRNLSLQNSASFESLQLLNMVLKSLSSTAPLGHPDKSTKSAVSLAITSMTARSNLCNTVNLLDSTGVCSLAHCPLTYNYHLDHEYHPRIILTLTANLVLSTIGGANWILRPHPRALRGESSIPRCECAGNQSCPGGTCA